MNTKRYAFILEIIGYLAAIGFIAATLLTWIFRWQGSDTPISHFFINYTTDQLAIQTMPIFDRCLGLIVDISSLAILLYGILCFIRLMRHFRTGSLFSTISIALLKRMSSAALAWTIYYPIHGALISVVTTLQHCPKTLSITLGSTDLINLTIFACLTIITIIVQEGYALQQERNFTI